VDPYLKKERRIRAEGGKNAFQRDSDRYRRSGGKTGGHSGEEDVKTVVLSLSEGKSELRSEGGQPISNKCRSTVSQGKSGLTAQKEETKVGTELDCKLKGRGRNGATGRWGGSGVPNEHVFPDSHDKTWD